MKSYIAIRRPKKLWHIATGKSLYSWNVICRSYLKHQSNQGQNYDFETEQVHNVLNELCPSCVREAYTKNLINLEWRLAPPDQVFKGVLK